MRVCVCVRVRGRACVCVCVHVHCSKHQYLSIRGWAYTYVVHLAVISSVCPLGRCVSLRAATWGQLDALAVHLPRPLQPSELCELSDRALAWKLGDPRSSLGPASLAGLPWVSPLPVSGLRNLSGK